MNGGAGLLSQLPTPDMGPVLAVGDTPAFIPVLAAIIVTAAVAGWLCQRVGLVPIVGFLVAGVLVGPNALGVVGEVEMVEVAAEVGVILLLFTIGIEFSLARLARVKRLVIGGGTLTVVLATAVTTVVVLVIGGGLQPAVYTGLLVSVSSTAVVLSLLASRRATSSPGGQLSVAVLVFEDIAVVGMVLLVPMLGSEGGSALDLGRALLTAVAVIAAVLVVARKVMPPLLEAVARVCAPEVFLLAVLSTCFTTAYLTSLAGVSVSLGAFLAGLVVSESRFSAHALGEILPLQIVFTATFFVSVGMLLDPAFLLEQPVLVAAAVLGVLAIKSLTGTVAARLVGVALPVAVASSLLRAQIGEFSFVLEQVGRDAGLSPADLGANGIQAFLAASVLLMVATPALAPAGDWLGGRLGSRASARAGPAGQGGPGGAAPPEVAAEALRDHVVVAGYGPAARLLVPELRAAGVPFVVVTLNPGGAEHAEGSGALVVRGDSSKRHILEEAEVRAARLVVIPDDDPEMAGRIASVVRTMNPAATIVARAEHQSEVGDLALAGVDVVVTDERASARQLADDVLARLDAAGVAGVARPLASPPRQVDTEAVVRFEPGPTACGHLAAVVPVLPSAAGCEECLRTGDRWVHLRICLTCGKVGCCDDSPNRHARAHAEGGGHPIVRSLEPGERWAWCFPDELELPPAHS